MPLPGAASIGSGIPEAESFRPPLGVQSQRHLDDSRLRHALLARFFLDDLQRLVTETHTHCSLHVYTDSYTTWHVFPPSAGGLYPQGSSPGLYAEFGNHRYVGRLDHTLRARGRDQWRGITAFGASRRAARGVLRLRRKPLVALAAPHHLRENDRPQRQEHGRQAPVVAGDARVEDAHDERDRYG